jgi:hypothetical protein
MDTNVNLDALIGALALMTLCGLMFAAAVALVFSIVQRKPALAGAAVIAMVAIGAIYLGLLLVFSFRSGDKLLVRGEEKYFCEMDCHLAYSISDVRETKILEDHLNPDNSLNRVTAGGTFWLVTIRTRFDANTPLNPNPRIVYVLDEQGTRYLPSPEGQLTLARSQDPGKAMSTPIRPGETYTTTVVFDLPVDVRNPTLLIQDDHPFTRLIIGHENSPFHKKIRFQL